MSAPFHGIRRLWSLCRKETLQIIRDPSTLLIALVFPVVLLFVFGGGINLDAGIVRIGVVSQDSSPVADRLVASFAASKSYRVELGHDIAAMGDRLRAGEIRGFVVIRGDFAERFARADATNPTVMVVTDGSEPNTAAVVQGDVSATYGIFLREELGRRGAPVASGFPLEVRSWFNPTTDSRNFLLPGSITITMTVVGALLTALVVAREWERGTMEALLAAGVTRFELVVSKLVPYYALGMVSYFLCVLVTTQIFAVPLRGSLQVIFLLGSAFLGSALGLGLLLSTTLRNQYNAAQAALNAAFLPALMLSGFVFEINSMPAPIRAVTTIVPAKYFVTGMQTVFQAGDVWSVLGRSLIGLSLASAGFLGLTFLLTRRRLE
jgi:ABC-2 type transport system permease protein